MLGDSVGVSERNKTSDTGLPENCERVSPRHISFHRSLSETTGSGSGELMRRLRVAVEKHFSRVAVEKHFSRVAVEQYFLVRSAERQKGAAPGSEDAVTEPECSQCYLVCWLRQRSEAAPVSVSDRLRDEHHHHHHPSDISTPHPPPGLLD